ncbi:MAG: hypothetical protein K2J36_06210 [Ruminococcus sp.]|nr:hypothetical protein [Ruminococcus sp.]MDE6797587.1 hypothetical protein [Ruminococcus sp.]
MYNKINLDNNYIFIDNICLNSIFEEIQGSNNFFEWLVSSLRVENKGELHYIMELVERKVSCNFPLLVCGDDLDFNCTIVVVKVEWSGDKVIWTKFGTVKREADYWNKYRNSGILRFEDWTDDDWQKYGSIAYELITDENFFDEWCSENWNEEVYRRTWGYYHRYFNDDKNIDWIGEVNFRFEVGNYLKTFDKMYKLY